ncbi:5-formyltetrahydrofolate cyclo-ligase [Pelagibacteraceae bacterium]|nr:5-formyltetrahydrofolate cyclo-ligase [Pelagibacteraceae bacterium]
MLQKNILRKKYLYLRKKKYYEINSDFFLPFINLIKSNCKKKNLKFALYYPSNFEVNILKLLESNYMKNKKTLIPVTEENNLMNFFPWKKNEVLSVNKFGLLEPIKSHAEIPDVMLVPVLAFDSEKFRLGYGKGFYDRYLNKYLKKFKNILTVGVAFSFQKYHKLPTDNNDVQLNYILTEKGIY